MSAEDAEDARDLWVVCGGAERSGSTLQYQLASEIVERTGEGNRLGFVRPVEFDAFLARHREQAGVKVVKVHRPSPGMLEALAAGEAVALHAHRDIRGALVSWMRFRQQGTDQIDRFVRQYLHGVAQWETAKGRILYSQYEQFTEHLGDELRRVADFLGIEVSPTVSEAIVQQLSPRRQRRLAEGLSVEDLDEQGRHDRRTLLHRNHFSPPGSPSWDEVLTSDDIARVERLAGTWLEEHGYKLTSARL